MAEKDEVILRACLFKIITDEDGESKITFKVSLEYLAKAITLNLFLQKEIVISIKEVKNG
jgi:hypothetical protein